MTTTALSHISIGDGVRVILIIILAPILFLAYLYFRCKLKRIERRATPEQKKRVAETVEMLMKQKGRNRRR